MLVRHHRGLSAGGQEYEYTYTGDEQHADLLTKAVSLGWDASKPGTFTAYVGNGTDAIGLYSSTASASAYGLSIGTFAADSVINLIVQNNAIIAGTGGTAGSAGGGGAIGSGGSGGSGGNGGSGRVLIKEPSGGVLCPGVWRLGGQLHHLGEDDWQT